MADLKGIAPLHPIWPTRAPDPAKEHKDPKQKRRQQSGNRRDDKSSEGEDGNPHIDDYA